MSLGWCSVAWAMAEFISYSIDLVGMDWAPPAQDLDVRWRKQAVHNLWKSALASVRVRHPDPRVDVRIETRPTWEGLIEIEFLMFNLSDTGTPDKSISTANGFRHRGVPEGWPGFSAARPYISALWGLYLLHESQELVTMRGTSFEYRSSVRTAEGRLVSEVRTTEIPVIDPHNIDGANQKALSHTSDIASTLDWGLGIGNGKKLVEQCADRAKIDVKNEIDFLAGRTARWE